MTFLATRPHPSVAPAAGTRTITTAGAQPQESIGSGEEGAGASDGNVVGVLRLRAGRARGQGPRVAWTEDVVDNEGMGKKKSKICCIYHKPKRFDESSDDSSSDSDDDSDSGCGGDGHGHDHRHAMFPNFRRRRGSSDEDDSSNSDSEADGMNRSNRRRIASPDQGCLQDGDVDGTVHEISDSDSVANAYERQPPVKGKKGKGKAVS